MKLMLLVTTITTEVDSEVTTMATEEVTVETTTEATTEVARTTKWQHKTPKTTNLPTEEETTPKGEAGKTEEVEVEITLKEEADKILASCRECFVNSVAKKVTEKISVTPESIAKSAKTKNLTQWGQKKAKKIKNLNMTKMTTMKPMKMSPASSKLSQQKTKKWFS
jgi:hypothetical protein